jgi:hypothetical protein
MPYHNNANGNVVDYEPRVHALLHVGKNEPRRAFGSDEADGAARREIIRGYMLCVAGILRHDIGSDFETLRRKRETENRATSLFHLSMFAHY